MGLHCASIIVCKADIFDRSERLPAASPALTLVLSTGSGQRPFKAKVGEAEGIVKYSILTSAVLGASCQGHGSNSWSFGRPDSISGLQRRGMESLRLAEQGTFESVFRARNHGCNVMIWFIPKHRVVLVSKSAPQRTLCVGDWLN